MTDSDLGDSASARLGGSLLLGVLGNGNTPLPGHTFRCMVLGASHVLGTGCYLGIGPPRWEDKGQWDLATTNVG